MSLSVLRSSLSAHQRLTGRKWVTCCYTCFATSPFLRKSSITIVPSFMRDQKHFFSAYQMALFVSCGIGNYCLSSSEHTLRENGHTCCFTQSGVEFIVLPLLSIMLFLHTDFLIMFLIQIYFLKNCLFSTSSLDYFFLSSQQFIILLMS